MDEQAIREVIREVLKSTAPEAEHLQEAPAPQQGGSMPSGNVSIGTLPLEVSARHVHLTRQAVEQLFGAGAKLTKKRDLSQPGEFLSEQRVKLLTKKGVIENVAVLGPERKAVQAELSATDCRTLDIQAPVNLSGDLTNAGDVMIAGDCGCISAPGSVIIARAHVHMTTNDARAFGVRDGERVSVALESARPVTLRGVIVRVREDFALACHIDFDEANAALASCKTPARILRFGAGDAAAVCPAPAAEAAQTPTFSEKLVTEAMARSVRKQGGEVCIRKGTIVTPAAMDIFTSAHMRVTYI